MAMVDGQVKLLGTLFSPFLHRVRIALAVKGINYVFIEENLQNKSELLLQSNPVHKKIPVLIHNGQPVCESIIILQYIDEAWETKAPSLMPKDPCARAIARFWAAFIDDKLIPSIGKVFAGQGEEKERAVEEWVENFLLLEESLGASSCLLGKPYFGGDDIGFLDIALGSTVVHLKVIQRVTDTVLLDPKKMPLLSAWMDRFLAAKAVKEVMLEESMVLDVLSALRTTLISSPASNQQKPYRP